jgi:hypothetical protein
VWGFIPGLANEEAVYYSKDFAGVPEANMKRVQVATEFVWYLVHQEKIYYCRKRFCTILFRDGRRSIFLHFLDTNLPSDTLEFVAMLF